MSEIKIFCNENNIITDADSILYLDGCGTILGFLHEFDFSYTEEDFHYVKALHDGTNPELDLWVKGESEKKWIQSLQGIKTFPSYTVLMEFKSKVEEAIREWVVAR
jgi:hypothetical protein